MGITVEVLGYLDFAYAPHLSNYAAAAGGRVFPSAAGFHTSQIFFTDDEGGVFPGHA
jgi:hypothetical protein